MLGSLSATVVNYLKWTVSMPMANFHLDVYIVSDTSNFYGF